MVWYLSICSSYGHTVYHSHLSLVSVDNITDLSTPTWTQRPRVNQVKFERGNSWYIKTTSTFQVKSWDTRSIEQGAGTIVQDNQSQMLKIHMRKIGLLLAPEIPHMHSCILLLGYPPFMLYYNYPSWMKAKQCAVYAAHLDGDAELRNGDASVVTRSHSQWALVAWLPIVASPGA